MLANVNSMHLSLDFYNNNCIEFYQFCINQDNWNWFDSESKTQRMCRTLHNRFHWQTDTAVLQWNAF